MRPRKALATLLPLFVILAMLAACGSDPAAPGGSPAATPTKPPTATEAAVTRGSTEPVETVEPVEQPNGALVTATPTENPSGPVNGTATPAPTPLGDPAVSIGTLTTPESFDEGGGFHRTLRFAPAPEPGGTVAVAVTDHAAIRNQFGIEAPPADAPDDEIQQYKLEMMGMADPPDRRVQRMLTVSGDVILSGFNGQYLLSIGWPGRYFGFGPGDVQQTLTAGFTDPQPSGAPEVVVGQMSPGAARESLAVCDECPEHETVAYAGQEYFAWGDDLQANLHQRLGPPAFDQFGRGGRVHAGEGHAFRTLTHAQMEELIDVASGAGSALDDDEDFVLAAQAMDTFGATSATMVRQPFAVDDVIESLGGEGHMESMEDPSYDVVLREYAAGAPPVPQPGAVATGIRVGDDGRHSVIAALVFDDPETAEKAESAIVDRLGAELPPGIGGGPGIGRRIETVEHGRSGRVVLLDLHPEGHARPFLSSVVFQNFFSQGTMFSRMLSPLLATESQEDS